MLRFFTFLFFTLLLVSCNGKKVYSEALESPLKMPEGLQLKLSSINEVESKKGKPLFKISESDGTLKYYYQDQSEYIFNEESKLLLEFNRPPVNGEINIQYWFQKFKNEISSKWPVRSKNIHGPNLSFYKSDSLGMGVIYDMQSGRVTKVIYYAL